MKVRKRTLKGRLIKYTLEKLTVIYLAFISSHHDNSQLFRENARVPIQTVPSDGHILSALQKNEEWRKITMDRHQA